MKHIFICLYQVKPSYHGASDISLNLFNSWPNKNKHLIQIINKKSERSDISNIKPRFGIFGRLANILDIVKVCEIKFLKCKKKIVVIEGASWAGYVFCLIKLLKYYFKDIKIIYHAHNLEYEVRKLKNNFLISSITFFFEKFIYSNSIGTSVSKKDKIFIKKKYLSNSILFENFIKPEVSRKIKHKNIVKKNFVFFCGSYSYWPNKIAINKIIQNKYKILKKFPKIKFIFTGEGLPDFKDKDIINLKIINKKNLIWLYKNCLFFYAPMTKAPGTKIKILEAIYYSANIICSNFALAGINKIRNIDNIFIEKDKNLSEILLKIKKYNNKKKINNFNFRKNYNIKYKVKKFYDQLTRKKLFK